MIRPEDAWRRLERHLRTLPPTTVARQEALGLRLATPLEATVDVPFADVSAMDGIAIAGEHPAGTEFAVAGVVAAGHAPGAELPAGSALRIMTGAPVPIGADRVVPVEMTRFEDRRVVLTQATSGKAHIRRRGEIVAAGAPLLPAGSPITPGALSLIATHGHDELLAHRAPRVAVVVTGNEVVPASETPASGQLRDAHTDFLVGAGRSIGLWVEPLGIAPDEPRELVRHLEAGLGHDVLLVTGGVSMGEYDYVEGALAELGFESLFDAVAVQPGKPLVAAVRSSDHGCRLVFGLPGNPASVMVAFWLFVRPALDRLAGGDDGFWTGALHATLDGPLPGAKGRDRFVPARLSARDGILRADPVLPRGSHDLAAFGRGAALLRIPAGSPPLPAGETCEALPLS